MPPCGRERLSGGAMGSRWCWGGAATRDIARAPGCTTGIQAANAGSLVEGAPHRHRAGLFGRPAPRAVGAHGLVGHLAGFNCDDVS